MSLLLRLLLQAETHRLQAEAPRASGFRLQAKTVQSSEDMVPIGHGLQAEELLLLLLSPSLCIFILIIIFPVQKLFLLNEKSLLFLANSDSSLIVLIIPHKSSLVLTSPYDSYSFSNGFLSLLMNFYYFLQIVTASDKLLLLLGTPYWSL